MYFYVIDTTHTCKKKKLLNSISLKLDFILGFGGFFLFYFFYGMAMQIKVH